MYIIINILILLVDVIFVKIRYILIIGIENNLGEIMYKKLFLALCLISINNTAISTEADYSSVLVKGFQNFESIHQLDVVNRLSAIADNDGVVFSKLWPREYFNNDGGFSYIYLVKNEDSVLDLIKFDVPVNLDGCMTKDNPEFCIPKFKPNMESFVYKERFIVESTPDFISKPQQQEILEVLVKDSKYFDTLKIKPIKVEETDEIYRKCDFEFDFLKSCQTLKKDTEELLSSEEIIMKEALTGSEDAPLDKALKYVKYDSEGNKLEEYVFSNGKHTFYDKKGKVIALEQFNDSKFKYMNSNLPDLYIDVEFKKDDAGRLIEESHYDSNHKLVRRYTAIYSGRNISKIQVEDPLNFATWEIVPIRISNIKEQAFAIRY